MSNLDAKTVEAYARLAHLHFEPEEARQMASDLESILDYVAQISEVDLSGVTPTFSVFSDQGPTREDHARPGLGQELAVLNAPDRESGFFLVPKMIQSKGN